MYDSNLLKSREMKMQEIPGMPIIPTIPTIPPQPRTEPFTIPTSIPASLNEYLRTIIGSYIELELLIGSQDRITMYGLLKGVGTNYILMEDIISRTVTAVDFYNIKYVKVINIALEELLQGISETF